MQSVRLAVVISRLLLLLVLTPVPTFAQGRQMQLVTPENGWARGKEGLFWTQDDGGTWKNISPPGVRYFNDVFFLDAFHGWALFTSEGKNYGSLDFHVATTADGGANWAISLAKTRAQAPGQFNGTAWLDFVDAQHGWLLLRQATSVGFSTGWVLATDDGGKSWTQLPDPPIAERPSFATPSTGFLAGGAGGDWLYVTHDAGKTWQEQNIPPPKSVIGATHPTYDRPEFQDEKHGFISVTFSPEIFGEGGQVSDLVLFTTDNGGQSWRPERVVPLAENMHGRVPLPSAFVDSTLTFFPTTDSEQRTLTLASVGADGKAQTAGTRVTDEQVREISFASPSHGWIATSGRYLSTSDGGATWKLLVPGEASRYLPPN